MEEELKKLIDLQNELIDLQKNLIEIQQNMIKMQQDRIIYIYPWQASPIITYYNTITGQYEYETTNRTDWN